MRRPATAVGRSLLHAPAACLPIAAARGDAARAQEAWPPAGADDLLKGTTRKFDEYGKVGFCDESARLDQFAITLQNEQGSKGYLLVYLGRDDLPAWKNAILHRPHDYLVTARGVDGGRLKVSDAGYREQRTTEMWLAAAEDPAPEPSNTVEAKVDRTKAYQWDRKDVKVEFLYEPPAEEAGGEGSEDEGGGDAAGGDEVSLWWSIEGFAEALKAEPGSRACLVYYYGKKNADGETVRGLLSRALVKMEQQFGLKGDRVITVDGGYSRDPGVELRVFPRGAEPPKPKVNGKRVIKFFAPPGE